MGSDKDQMRLSDDSRWLYKVGERNYRYSHVCSPVPCHVMLGATTLGLCPAKGHNQMRSFAAAELCTQTNPFALKQPASGTSLWHQHRQVECSLRPRAETAPRGEEEGSSFLSQIRLRVSVLIFRAPRLHRLAPPLPALLLQRAVLSCRPLLPVPSPCT